MDILLFCAMKGKNVQFCFLVCAVRDVSLLPLLLT